MLGLGDYRYISDLVRERAGIVLGPGKRYFAEARLTYFMTQTGREGKLTPFLRELQRKPDPSMLQGLVEALTNNETTFFRDEHPFEALRTTLLPEIIERNRDRRTLTIWSGACSSGQEPYSLSILFREHFPEVFEHWRLRIVATDINRSILDRARLGRFTDIEVGRGLPQQYRHRYFRKEGRYWLVDSTLKRPIQYSTINLIRSLDHLPHFDVALLRNVLIYFDVPTKKDILERLVDHLRPDSALLLGAAETTINITSLYQTRKIGRTVCYVPRSQDLIGPRPKHG